MRIVQKNNDESMVKKNEKKIIKKKVTKNKKQVTDSSKSILLPAEKQKKSVVRKKSKSVIVDVISDNFDSKDNDAFISDESLSNTQILETVKELGNQAEDFDVPADEIDRQKQFFSDLVSDMKKRQISDSDNQVIADSENSNKKTKKRLNLYKQRAGIFFFLVLFWAAIVGYFSFVKLTINITPQVEVMNDILFLRINGDDKSDAISTDAREQINGSISELDLSVEKSYPASGEELLGEEIKGTVTIINNNNKDQSLIATTRLLTIDGKLFRLKEGVSVPAGGRVQVEIYADKISEDMAISPTRFTIPGLWVGLQDKIFAENDEPFVYQQKSEKYITDTDIKLANSEASTLLINKAKDLKPLREQDKLLYQIIDPIDISINAQVGDKQENFTMEVKAKVAVISFSQDEIETLAQTKMNLLTPDDKELLELKSENMTYVLESFDAQAKTAMIKVSFSGLMALKGNADIIDKEKLKKLRADQIALYLRNFPEISEYELEFQPSFVKKAPYLVDRIHINIKK